MWHQPKNIVLEHEDQKTLCDDWGCKPHEAVIVAEFPSSVSCCGGYGTRRAIKEAVRWRLEDEVDGCSGMSNELNSTKIRT